MSFEEASTILCDALNYPADRALHFVQMFDRNHDGRLSAAEFSQFTNKIDETFVSLTDLGGGRGVDPYGTGQRDTSPQYLDWGGHYHECPPQYFSSNISYFLSMQYFLHKFKEFLVFLVFSRLVQGVVGTL